MLWEALPLMGNAAGLPDWEMGCVVEAVVYWIEDCTLLDWL